MIARCRLSTDYRTALETACYCARLDCVKLLAESVRQRNAGRVSDFINQQSGRGRTALFRACAFCSTACAAQLLELKAQPDLVDKEGYTALMVACNLQSPRVANHRLVTLLLAADANPDKALRATGETPLMMAAANGHVKALTELIAAGASLDVADLRLQQSALLRGCCRPDGDIVRKLLLEGARYDVCDAEGRSTLHLAALNGCHDVLNVLLASRLDLVAGLVNRPTNDGLTPLMLAVKYGWWRCVRTLVHCADTDLDAKDLGGNTAHDLAGVAEEFDCLKEIEHGIENRRQHDAGSPK